MPELDFQVTRAEAVAYGMTPLLHFNLSVTNKPGNESIQAVLLHAQIQIESPRRTYNASEKEKLSELFGTPERWGQTLRNRLWTHANVMVRAFAGQTDCILPVTCTYDFNLTMTKYFHALEEGDVCLLFLFSGTVFYLGADDRLQTQLISWDKECGYRLPVQTWREMMDHHYPNSAWLYLHRDSFERLYDYKRRHGLATWEQTIEHLLPATEPKEARA
jgi:hypothetical protein